MDLAALALNDLAAWVAAAIGLGALLVAWLAYRSQRGRLRFEYLVITNTKLLPGRLADQLRVSHNDALVTEPALSIVRMVNSGDRAIERDAFDTDLVCQFEGVEMIASATWNATRPGDLRPATTIDGDCVRIQPILINAEDMLEMQVLSAGQAQSVFMSGRIANLRIVQRTALPYNPGTGPEGELTGVVDKFMWFILSPGAILGVGALIAFDADNSPLARVVTLASTAILAGVLYPVVVRRLVRRRRLWSSYSAPHRPSRGR